MADQLSTPSFRRNVAFKLRIGNIMSGNPIFEQDKLIHVDVAGKSVLRVNVIANIVDKYVQEGEKKYGNVTLDDATGQIKAKLFGDDLDKIKDLTQGDTVLVVGLLRSWNEEVYITPEIIKKKDPAYLMVRKLEVEGEQTKDLAKSEIADLKDKIVGMVKEWDANGGIDIEKIIMELKEPPEAINKEIKKLLEDGVAYEPRPGKLRYLG
jgi:RPA family protein